MENRLEDCQVCGDYICICRVKPFYKLEDWEIEFNAKFTNKNKNIRMYQKTGKIKNFIHSLHSKWKESLVEATEKMLVNTPEEVAELNKHLPSTIQEQSYLEAIGYTKAVKDIITIINSK